MVKIALFGVAVFFSLSGQSVRAPVTDIFDTETLEALDQPGLFSLATVLQPENAGNEKSEMYANAIRNGDRLKKLRLNSLYRESTYFRDIADTIAADTRELMAQSGLKFAYSAQQAESLAPAGNIGRHFDWHWLTSASAAFTLVAVVNRIDRKDFYDSGCGEIRLIYRLAYSRRVKKGKQFHENYSTLPVFLNVVFERKTADCRAAAREWSVVPQLPDLLSRNHLRLRQIELNMQVLRFPSGQMTDFGGQAVYLLRIFGDSEGKFQPLPLENTPDVSLIASDVSLQTDLARQLSDEKNLPLIDRGTFVLHNTSGKMLAKRALSFSTTGRQRLANKPFASLYGHSPVIRDVLSQAKLESMRFVASIPGLLERLDAMSCMGCHQTNSTAGFHTLGINAENNSSFNRTLIPFSPHFHSERNRRISYLFALAGEANPDLFRPHPAYVLNSAVPGAIATPQKSGVRGLCLRDTRHFKMPLACADKEAECLITAQNERLGFQIGECVVRRSAPAKAMFGGHICRLGKISDASPGALQKIPPHQDFNLSSFKDRITDLGGTGIPAELYANSASLRNFFCGEPRKGTPLGRIAKKCVNNSAEGRLEFAENLSGNIISREVCAVSGGTHFDACAAGEDPVTCLTNTPVARTMLDICYQGQFCREDYICQKLPREIALRYTGTERHQVSERIDAFSSRGYGFCTPNYFIFNMRIDGHILPEKRQQEAKR